MSEEFQDNVKVGEQRKVIVKEWIEDLKQSGEWKLFVYANGDLKVSAAKQRLRTIETGEEEGSWDNNYFKRHHWSYAPRKKFEKWVKDELAGRPDYDLFGGQLKESLGLPLWLENEELSKDVQKLLVELAAGRKSDKEEIKGLKSRLDKRDQKILDLNTRLQNLDHRHASIDDHYMNSVRTFRYNADMDIDLSKEGLFDMEVN